MKAYIADLLARLGKIRSECDAGRNESARQLTQDLERDIVAEQNEQAPGVAGTVVELDSPTTPEDPEPDDESTAPDGDVTPVTGQPPVPGSAAT